MRAPDPLRIVFISAITAAICVKSLYWVKGDELRNPPPVSGRGEVSGQVVDGQGQPVPHASIRARARGIDHVWSGRTTADGRFTILALPAGSFTVSAVKDGFVEASYGETDWQVGQRSITIDEQHHAQEVQIVMARAGSIGGIVYDENGQPAPGRFMRLLRRTNGARAELVTQGWPVRGTDPYGRYRFENLAPGTYYVMAAFDSAVLARVYHPNVSRVAEAKPITLGLGEDREGIDLHYRPVPSSRVSGTIARADGGPIEHVIVRLARAGGLDPDDRNLHRRIGRAGRFDFESVPAGAYWVVAHGTAPAADAEGAAGRPQRFWGFGEITVDGRQPLATTIAMTPGVEISGRVELHAVDGHEPVDRSKVVILLWGVDARTDAMLSIESLRSSVAPNGSFVISGVPAGRYTMQAWRQPWLLGSALDANGRHLDQPFEVTAGGDVRDVTITLADRPAGISGLLLDDQDQPLGDQQLLVFPADSRLWYPSAMRTQLSRSSADGTFTVAGLLAGEYLIAAIEDVNRESWFDRARFERARAGAARVTLTPGQRVTRDLRVPTRIRRP
jgi:hypothetical protein